MRRSSSLANPLLTPNPAKAPWYFLGLQELLHYFPPLVAGIIIPTLVVIGLIVIPYFNVNVQGQPLWRANRKRTLSIFLAVLFVLTCPAGLHARLDGARADRLVAGLMLYSYSASSRSERARRIPARRGRFPGG